MKYLKNLAKKAIAPVLGLAMLASTIGVPKANAQEPYPQAKHITINDTVGSYRGITNNFLSGLGYGAASGLSFYLADKNPDKSGGFKTAGVTFSLPALWYVGKGIKGIFDRRGLEDYITKNKERLQKEVNQRNKNIDQYNKDRIPFNAYETLKDMERKDHLNSIAPKKKRSAIKSTILTVVSAGLSAGLLLGAEHSDMPERRKERMRTAAIFPVMFTIGAGGSAACNWVDYYQATR